MRHTYSCYFRNNNASLLAVCEINANKRAHCNKWRDLGIIIVEYILYTELAIWYI